jgi:hypothetical protein
VKRGLVRTICIVLTFLTVVTLGPAASAQTAPVQPVAPPAPYAPPVYYPPPPPAYNYPRGPARLRYEEGDPIPPGYRVVNRSRQGLVIAGTVTFLVSYGIPLTIALVANFEDETSWLAIPLAGPWLTMYALERPSCNSSSDPGCFDQGVDSILRFYLAADGVVQAAGALMLAFGLAGRKILVRDGSYASVQFLPARLGPTGYGAMFTGRF